MITGLVAVISSAILIVASIIALINLFTVGAVPFIIEVISTIALIVMAISNIFLNKKGTE